MLVPIDEVVHFDVVTHATTGAVTDADSTPTFAVFEEATDTDIGVGGNLTKRTSLTGNYRGTFTASTANGFEAGKWYVVIATATVGGTTGKTVAMHFRCAPAESVAGVPKADTSYWNGTAPSNLASGRVDVTVGAMQTDVLTSTALAASAVTEIQSGLSTLTAAQVNAECDTALADVGLTTTVTSRIDVATSTRLAPTVAGRTLDVTVGGEAGIDWANIGSPTTTVALSGTTISSSQVAASVTANVSANVVAWNGTAPSNLISGRVDATVGAMQTDVLTSTALAASAVTEIQAGLSTLTSAQVNAECDTALADVGLTTTITGRIDAAVSSRLATSGYTAPDNTTIANIYTKVDTEVASILSVTNKLDTTMELDGAVYRFTENALEMAPAGGGGGGGTDWTSDERKQIRYRLGIDGTTEVPTATPNLEIDTSSISTAVINSAIMAITTGSRVSDANGVEKVSLTLAEAMSLLVVGLLGDRSGVNTSELVATLTGVADYRIQANRNTASTIRATITVPA